jgi:putative NADPH-quinone reductase
MTARRIVVINGHPDPSGERLCGALTAAYLSGANFAGHQFRRLDVGAMDLPALRSAEAFGAAPDPAARAAQDAILWADHLVIIYPLWQGGPPALLKVFLEQVFRYGFALSAPGSAKMEGLLKGRSARVIVTMGMPAFAFRLAFASAGLRALSRGVLWVSGLSPIRSTVLGGVEGPAYRRAGWLRKVEALGRQGR